MSTVLASVRDSGVFDIRERNWRGSATHIQESVLPARATVATSKA